MGWCLDVARVGLRDIFKKEKRGFKLTHPLAAYPTVDIAYSVNEKKDISDSSKELVMSLFPPDVYVNFIKLDGPEDKYNWDS